MPGPVPVTLPTPDEARTSFGKGGIIYALWCIYCELYQNNTGTPMNELLLPCWNWLIGAGSLVTASIQKVAYLTGRIFALVARSAGAAQTNTWSIPFEFPSNWNSGKPLSLQVQVNSLDGNTTAMTANLVTTAGDNVTASIAPANDGAWHTLIVNLLPAANDVAGTSGILTFTLTGNNGAVMQVASPKFLAQ